MNYRKLTPEGPEISVIGFGMWTVSTPMWGIKDDQIGLSLINEAFLNGITFFDTADVYGDGRGETMLREGLGDHRDEIVIATKFGYDFYNYPGVQPGQRERPQDWSPAFVRKVCEESLKRLGTDYIDLYQLHNPRLDAINCDDLWAELHALRDEGKIRVIGAALGPALKPERQIDEGITAIRERGAPLQIIYNMLEQPLGNALFPIAAEQNAGIIVRVPHASGLLEGNYNENTRFEPSDHRQHRVPTDEARKKWLIEGLKKVESLRFLARDEHRTMGQAALLYVLLERSIISALPNIYNREQLLEFAHAPDAPALTLDEIARVADILSNSDYALTDINQSAR